MTTELLRTPLHDWHVAHGGRMVDFAGWSMPVQYSSIVEEHHATRNAVGVFDISHMGRLLLFGDGDCAARFLDTIVTRRVIDMRPFQVRYALLCNEHGGILDDVLVCRGTQDPVEGFVVVVNASNRRKIVDWFEHNRGVSQVQVRDETIENAMFAIQGPSALELVQPFIKLLASSPFSNLHNMPYYFSAGGHFEDMCVSISRTGYTGEDGCEIMCDAEDAAIIWEKLISLAESVGGMACGLGARDTLRLEAAMPLYGHELSESINPIQAGLGFAVNLKDRTFIGSEALARFAADKSQPVRIGLELTGKRVPRQGCPVLHEGKVVGEVTSGTFSPTLDKPIAMAYVHPTAQALDTNLQIDIRGTQHPATVVPLPFYSRKKD